MKRLAYIFAAIHLMVIGLAVSHGIDPFLHRWGLEFGLAILRDLNYSVWRYSFFAPDVGFSTELSIRVFRDDGTVVEYSTLDNFRFFTASQESANRFYGLKRRATVDETFGDLGARSLATRMINLHESASRIDIAMRSIRFPNMEKFRQGEKAAVAELYSTTFALR